MKSFFDIFISALVPKKFRFEIQTRPSSSAFGRLADTFDDKCGCSGRDHRRFYHFFDLRFAGYDVRIIDRCDSAHNDQG